MKLSTAKKIRSLYDSGQSVRAISKQFGISRSYCYQVLRNEVCFDVFYKPQTLKTKVDVDAAWALLKEHKTQAQIADELSTEENRISPSIVGYHLRRRWEEELEHGYKEIFHHSKRRQQALVQLVLSLGFQSMDQNSWNIACEGSTIEFQERNREYPLEISFLIWLPKSINNDSREYFFSFLDLGAKTNVDN